MVKHSNIPAIGVHAVQGIIMKDFDWIFRQEDKEDVGIDGLIEVKEQGTPTNKRLAVQIKTGESHFHRYRKRGLVYYIENKHYDYWIKGNLAVLIIAHIPNGNETYWEYLHPSKITKTSKRRKILIPYSQPLSSRFSDRLKEIINKHKGSPLFIKPTIKSLYELAKDENTSNDAQMEKILGFLQIGRAHV